MHLILQLFINHIYTWIWVTYSYKLQDPWMKNRKISEIGYNYYLKRVNGER